MTYYSSSTDGPQGQGGPRAGGPWQGRCHNRMHWRPLELVAMIAGFAIYWPIGLAILVLKMWQRRSGHSGDLMTFAQEKTDWARNTYRDWQPGNWSGRGGFSGFGGFGGMRPTGNVAFDEWRAAELARLEEERRKLEQAEREFADHIAELRRARDREEFDRFMSARRRRPEGDTSSSA